MAKTQVFRGEWDTCMYKNQIGVDITLLHSAHKKMKRQANQEEIHRTIYKFNSKRISSTE